MIRVKKRVIKEADALPAAGLAPQATQSTTTADPMSTVGFTKFDAAARQKAVDLFKQDLASKTTPQEKYKMVGAFLTAIGVLKKDLTNLVMPE